MTEYEQQSIDGMKRNIDQQLIEYEQAIAKATAWYREWKAKRGFRCIEKQKADG